MTLLYVGVEAFTQQQYYVGILGAAVGVAMLGLHELQMEHDLTPDDGETEVLTLPKGVTVEDIEKYVQETGEDLKKRQQE